MKALKMTNDLEEFCGKSAVRNGMVKKRAALQVRLDKLSEKATPLVAEIEMYDKMIKAHDDFEAQKAPKTEEKPQAEEEAATA